MAIQVFKSQQRGSEPDDRPPGGRCATVYFRNLAFLLSYPRGLPQLLADLFSWRPRVFRIFSQFFSGRRGGDGALGARV